MHPLHTYLQSSQDLKHVSEIIFSCRGTLMLDRVLWHTSSSSLTPPWDPYAESYFHVIADTATWQPLTEPSQPRKMGATFCPLKNVVTDPRRGRLLTFLCCVAWVTVPGFSGIYLWRVMLLRAVINTRVVDCSRPFRIKWSVSSNSYFAAKNGNQTPAVGSNFLIQSWPSKSSLKHLYK